MAAYAEAITDGIQDELRHRLFDAIWVRRQNLSSAYDVRRVVTAITWPAAPVYFHLASPDLLLPLLHDPDPVRIVRRSGGTVPLDGGPLTSTGYRRCRDWQEQWLALPRQVTRAGVRGQRPRGRGIQARFHPDRDPDRRRDQSHGYQHRCHRDSFRDAGR